MATKQNKSRPFNNTQTVALIVNEVEGTVTIPIMLEESDLNKYIIHMDAEEKKRQAAEQIVEGAVEGQRVVEESPASYVVPLLIQQLRSRHESRRHMVKGIDFPGVSIEQYKPGGKMPFPAVVQAVSDILDGVIRDALNLPNS